MGRAFARLLGLGIVFVLILTACELPVSPTVAGFTIDVFDPPNGAVLQSGREVYVDAEAHSSAGDITRIDEYANGVWFAGISGADLIADSYGVTGEGYWTPAAAGEYLLQASAMRRGGMLISGSTRVCVVDFPIDPGNAYTTSYGYEGECPIPPRDAAARPGTITMATDARPDHLVYIAPDASGVILPTYPGCMPQTTLSFQSTVVDPPEDVALVAIHISLPTGPATRPSWSSLGDVTSTFLLHQTAAYAGSTRIFEGSTDPRPTLGFIFGDRGGTVSWTAQAIGRDGAILLTDGPHTIPAAPCAPAAPLSAPFTPTVPVDTATPTLVPQPTACPPGTYLAPNSNKCVQVYFTPTSKPVSCKSYHDASACTTNGCSWDKGTNTCSH